MENMEIHPETEPIYPPKPEVEEYTDPLTDSDVIADVDESENYYPIDSVDTDTSTDDEIFAEDGEPTKNETVGTIEPEQDDQPESGLSPYPFALSAGCETADTWGFTIEAVNATDSVLESTVAPHGGPDRDSDEFNPDVVYDLIVEPGEFGSVTVTNLPEVAWYEWTTEDMLLANLSGDMIDFSLCATITDEEFEQPTEQEELEETTEESSEEITEIIVEKAEPQAQLAVTGAGENIALMLAFGAAAVITGAKMVWSQRAAERRASQ